MTDPRAIIKKVGGTIRFLDRTKLAGAPETPGPSWWKRWTAFVTVFGHSVAGEGATQRAAVEAAVGDLPEQYKRHFRGEG